MSAVHRVQQGVRALLAFTQSVDYDLAAQYLTADQLSIFKQMKRSEQHHSLNVLRAVQRQQAHTPHDLALAALLHDVGKVRAPQNVIGKSLSVLVNKFTPMVEDWLCADDRLVWWRAPFIVRCYHPKWSGEILAGMGASARATWLVTHHQDAAEHWRDHPYYELLCRLQRADDVN